MKRAVMILTAAFTATVTGVIVAAALLAVAAYVVGDVERVVGIFNGGEGPGLTTPELLLAGAGLAIGFGAGLALWALIVNRIGLMSLDEIADLINKR